MAVETETETHRRPEKRRRMNNESSSFFRIEDLQDDLLLEILCRVSSYRCLMRSRCVSKRWLSLISNPSFVTRQRFLSNKKLRPWTFIQRSVPSGIKLITSEDPVFQSQGFSFSLLPCHQANHQPPVPIRVLQASNDLVLFSPFTRRDFHHVYYLCNPFTMQCEALPQPPPSARGRVIKERLCDAYEIFVSLICEPHKDEEEEGVATCRFKVVRSHRYEVPRITSLELDVFSSETGQWIKYRVDPLPNKPFPVSRITEIVTCNGTLFALAIKSPQIMALNLNSLFNNKGNCSTSSHDHDYHLLELPKVDDLFWQSTPIAYQGRLRLVHITKNDLVPVLYIWELKEDYYNLFKADCEYWSLVHRVSFADVVATNCSEWYLENIGKTRMLPCEGGLYITPLNFQPDDGDILCLSFSGRVASYDMWNKTLSFHHETSFRSIWQVHSPFLQLVFPSCPTTIPKV